MKHGMRFALVVATVVTPALAQTQSAMNGRAAHDARTADQALNAQYSATMAKLSPPSRLLLRNAQRSWIGFRDQQCKFEASGVAGCSAYPLVYATCLERMTGDRTRQLKQYGRCQEGDLSCPR